jgi:hypothetical protein
VVSGTVEPKCRTTQIGYGGKKGDDPFDKIFTLSTGNVCHNPDFVIHLELIHSHPRIIVTAFGFLPGYYFTLFTIDIIGRKWLQFGGFIMSCLFLAILAGEVDHLGKGPLIACFTFLQFFLTLVPIPEHVSPRPSFLTTSTHVLTNSYSYRGR